ncbi:MAG: hypothetical protein M1410_04470 [Candidatus Thermoplasmatota archaeon]|nr:hypothetical protein [Candidatus Thermoplasmatota archaeon]
MATQAKGAIYDGMPEEFRYVIDAPIDIKSRITKIRNVARETYAPATAKNRRAA